MTLIDTGPLIALIDKGQGETHIRCVETYQKLTGSFLTTWPCFTEAMYFLSELRGWSAQAILWEFVNRKALYLHSANEAECKRMKVKWFVENSVFRCLRNPVFSKNRVS